MLGLKAEDIAGGPSRDEHHAVESSGDFFHGKIWGKCWKVMEHDGFVFHGKMLDNFVILFISFLVNFNISCAAKFGLGLNVRS